MDEILCRNQAATSLVEPGDHPANQPPLVNPTGGWLGRWRRNLESIGRAERTFHTIVDVGARSLQTDEGIRFFVEHKDQTISVWANPEVVFQRHPDRDKSDFFQTEHSEERKLVYSSSRFIVDTSCSVEESMADFLKAICELTGWLR